ATGASDARGRGWRGTTKTAQAPRKAARRATAPALEGAHSIVLRVVLDLREAEHLEDRRHVHPEASAQTFLQAVPALDRILWRSPPRLDGALGRRLLLVGTPEEHPVAVLLQHRVQIVNGPEVVAQLRLADDAYDGGRIGIFGAIHLVIGRSTRRLQLPRLRFGALARDLGLHVLPLLAM